MPNVFGTVGRIERVVVSRRGGLAATGENARRGQFARLLGLAQPEVQPVLAAQEPNGRRAGFEVLAEVPRRPYCLCR